MTLLVLTKIKYYHARRFIHSVVYRATLVTNYFYSNFTIRSVHSNSEARLFVAIMFQIDTRKRLIFNNNPKSK